MENVNKYKSSAELKALAKEHLFGRYGTIIGASVLFYFLVGIVSIFFTAFLDINTWTGFILNYLISFVIFVLTGLISSGFHYMYLKIACCRPVTVSDAFYGFQLYPNKALQIQLFLSIWIYIARLPMMIFNQLLLRDPKNPGYILYSSLGAILFIVVATMIFLIYSQTYFLLHDFPEYSVKELLATSKNLMKGSKGRLFYLIVSFIPLMLLGLLSCGIALLWVIPYINATSAEFFLDLIKKKQPVSVVSQ